MQNLKDSLGGNSKAVTLSPEEVQHLLHMNQYLQAQLDAIQQHMAGQFLNYVVVHRFDFPPGLDLRFNFDPAKEVDNLTITEFKE